MSQNAFRRLKPTEPLPQDLKSFQGKAIFSKYLERQGGFSGQRDLGLTTWLVAQIADQMLAGDTKGAQELAARWSSAQDGGRWDLAWVLSLQEDPCARLFASRPAQTNPRLKAFAPLCPAPWTLVALNYVKELDAITSRRAELQGPKKNHEKASENKKRPRFPKKKAAQLHPADLKEVQQASRAGGPLMSLSSLSGMFTQQPLTRLQNVGRVRR